jgi:glutathione transport system permease protein
MAISVAGVSVPVFFLGLVLIWFVGFQWQLLPFTGRGGPLWTMEGLRASSCRRSRWAASSWGPWRA